MQLRENALKDWLKVHVKFSDYSLTALSGDASFRRYFRLQTNNNSFVIMDAPPEQENIQNFLLIANFLYVNGFSVPQIYASNQDLGFIMLEDFGDQQFITITKHRDSRLKYYQNALDVLLKMQSVDIKNSLNFSYMDRDFYMQELNLFKIWFLHGYLQINCSLKESLMIDEVFNTLIEHLLKIPLSFVHRDFHSRNLMIINEDKLGILDFQDGVVGPITYDLVSLLRDCYLRLTPQELSWCLEYFYNSSLEF